MKCELLGGFFDGATVHSRTPGAIIEMLRPPRQKMSLSELHDLRLSPSCERDEYVLVGSSGDRLLYVWAPLLAEIRKRRG